MLASICQERGSAQKEQLLGQALQVREVRGEGFFTVKRHYPAGKCEGAPSERFRARIPLRISEPSLDAACVVCPLARYPAFSMPSRLNSSLRECTSSFW